MKFALIVDKCKVESYIVRDKKAYKLSNPEIPYQFHHSVSNECFIGFWGYPFVFNGCFINWSEYDDNLPELDLDLIFVAIESDYQKYTIDKLRKAYPYAKIVAVLKETWNWQQYALQRINVYNQCDHIFSCISDSHYEAYMPELQTCTTKVTYMPQPVNTDYLYDNFYSETRSECIFSYLPVWNPSRIGRTEEFTKYISNKTNITYVRTHTNDNTNKWHDFLKVWTPCTFHFNLDPMPMFPGQQAMQCAALGVIHIGGENDSHKILWPETATNDFDTLEYYFNLYLTDYDKRTEVIQNAYSKLNDIYSYTAVYNKTIKVLGL